MPNEDAREFFTRHHEAYRVSESHTHGADLAALLDALRLPAVSRVLDVATGTGHTALALAALGHQVVGVDLTEAMLQDARALAAERGLTASVSFVVGDASQLPFDDGTFQVVTSRRAPHHFADLPGFLAEAFRVLTPGGRLGIADLTADDVDVDALNDLERLRDPSHRTALSPEAWQDAISDAGFHLRSVERLDEEMLATAWLAPVSPESEEGRLCLERIARGLVPASIATPPDRFHKHRVVLTAARP